MLHRNVTGRFTITLTHLTCSKVGEMPQLWRTRTNVAHRQLPEERTRPASAPVRQRGALPRARRALHLVANRAQEGRASARPQRCAAALERVTAKAERPCAGALRPRRSAALLGLDDVCWISPRVASRRGFGSLAGNRPHADWGRS